MDMVYSEVHGVEHRKHHDDIHINELNTLLGSNLENMLLSCKWHEGFHCGPENFTEIITDGGRCYTFNAQRTDTVLGVHNIGSEKGVRFLINTEEYERMPLSSMSAGLRILIHEQSEYPLVKQLGQSVAPGNHAFISLKLKKEFRMGPPYDDCHDGELRFIPNTYRYTLPACQTECYFAHTLSKCGCSDFFIPANFSSCTLAQYETCLRKVQRLYPVIEQKTCDCHKPCNTQYISADYSYGALSELAIETLKEDALDNIRDRHRKAVDIYQFISRETQYKKRIFLNFTTVLDKAKELYASDLNLLETTFSQTIGDCAKKYFKLCDTIDEILWEQTLIIKKEFVEPSQRMDRTTIGRVIDDMFMITARVQNLVLDHTSHPTSDTRLRYIVLMDDLRSRAKLLDATLHNLNTIKDSFSSGSPLSNVSFSKDETQRMRWSVATVVPKKLLRKAFAHENSSKVKSSIENISSSLSRMMEIVEKTFETKDNNIQQLEETVREFTDNCNSYISAKEIFFEETVERPLYELGQKIVFYRESKLTCGFHFKAILGTIQKETVRLGVSLASANGHFSRLGKALSDYLAHFNASNFDIAELVLGNKFMSATSNLDAVSHEMRDNVNELYGLLNNVIDCLDDNLKKVIADEALSDLLEVISADIGVSVMNLSRDISVGIYDIQKSFMRREESNEVSFRLLELSNTIMAEYRKFTESTKIDISFYRRNFIFLDIFFGDISYTVMKQQKVYSGYDLFSDIGGSMGLLVGASVISLLEIMDLFCLLSIALCRK
ncbi:Acid-sensing ion channel 3 [Bulinus truncatus]|nr:Acid-sensing ion channel 3 [Bulinus truncatus]